MKKIAIVGIGGFGQEVFCIWKDMLEQQNEPFEFIGFFDDADTLLPTLFGNVVGKVEDLNTISYPIDVAIAVGNSFHLKNISEKLYNENLSFPNIIHPTVQFLGEETLKIGKGNIFSLGAYISCNVIIGNFNIFNTRSTLGHDDRVGDYNIFSPNTQISGKVSIENSNFFGFSSGVIQNKKIGNNNTIGAGSILLRNIKNEGTYIGNPAIKVKLT